MRGAIVLGLALSAACGVTSCCKGNSGAGIDSSVEFAKLPCEEGSRKEVIVKGTIQECKLSDTVAVGPVNCLKGRIIRVYPSDKLKECSFSGKVKVGEISCDGRVNLDEEGRLLRCKLGAPATLNEVAIPAGSWVAFHQPSGMVHRLELMGPTPVKGYKCQGSYNYFHENGQLHKCKLAEPATVQGKTFEAGKDVCFDHEGKLADCKMFRFEMVH